MIRKRLLGIILVLALAMAGILSAYAIVDEAKVSESNLELYTINAQTEGYLLEYCRQPSSYIESDAPEIIALSDKITSGIDDDYKKAKAIHDWICINIWYDLDMVNDRDIETLIIIDTIEKLFEYLESNGVSPFMSALKYPVSAIGTLENGRSVCEGYTRLSVALLRAAGIPAKFAYGTAIDDGKEIPHAWTEMYVEDRWMIMDTTWDSGNKWENGKKTKSYGLLGSHYFDMSFEEFSKEHKIEGYEPFIGSLIEDGKLILCGDAGEGIGAITSIGENAFEGNQLIKNVNIPYGVTEIPEYAFMLCSALESVNLPGTVNLIGSAAFAGCSSLKSINIPSSVTKIDSLAFIGCSQLSELIIPPGVVEIDIGAFLTRGKTLTIYGIPGSEAERCVKNYLAAFKGGQYGEYVTKIRFVPLTAKPASSTVMVNSETVAFDAYNINDNNYFKLRDLAYILSGSAKQFDVVWNGATGVINLTSGQPYTKVGGEMEGKGTGNKTPAPTTSRIFLDGEEVILTAYNIGGNNYFKLRDIGAVLDISVTWDGASNTIIIGL